MSVIHRLVVLFLLAGSLVACRPPTAPQIPGRSDTVTAALSPSAAITALATAARVPSVVASSTAESPPGVPTSTATASAQAPGTIPPGAFATSSTSPTPPTPTPLPGTIVPATVRVPSATAAPTVTRAPSATSAPTALTLADGWETIVDNHDPRLVTVGVWFLGDGGHNYGPDCLWAPRSLESVANARPNLPRAGFYEVYAWWPGDPNHDQVEREQVGVSPDGARASTVTTTISFQSGVGRWSTLGTYYLQADCVLTMRGSLEGNIVADAFRFVYRANGRMEAPATPWPTLQMWSNHPPSPLAQTTSGDLSVRLGLVGRFYESAPLVSIALAQMDDCEAFPRGGCGGTREAWRVQVQYQNLIVSYRVAQDYRLVALEAPTWLGARQVRYLYGSTGESMVFVDRYPDSTWHLTRARYDGQDAHSVTLEGDALTTLRSLAQTYGSVRLSPTTDATLALYGLGTQCALSELDAARLAALWQRMLTIAVSPGP